MFFVRFPTIVFYYFVSNLAVLLIVWSTNKCTKIGPGPGYRALTLMKGNCDIGFFIFRHQFHIMRPKFLKFVKD